MAWTWRLNLSRYWRTAGMRAAVQDVDNSDYGPGPDPDASSERQYECYLCPKLRRDR